MPPEACAVPTTFRYLRTPAWLARSSRQPSITDKSRPQTFMPCKMNQGKELRGVAPCPDHSTGAGRPVGILCREGMLDLVALCYDFGGLWLAGNRASNGFLGGAVIIVLDFLVVRCFPMNENADTHKQIVGLSLGDDAFRHAVGHRLAHRMLSWPEHLDRLFGVFDRDLVEQHRRGLAHQVRRHQRKQRSETVLVVCQTICKRYFGSASARPHNEINVRDLVTFADK